MGRLDRLVIHCSATPEGVWFDDKDIIRWHTAPKSEGGRGWSRPGYSDVILLDGNLVNLTPYNEDNIIEDDEMTWGARGYNSTSRHLCYIGGTDKDYNPKDTRTELQYVALQNYIRQFLAAHPECTVCGHNELPGVRKACPSFSVKAFMNELGLADYWGAN